MIRKIKDWWYKFKLYRTCPNCGGRAIIMVKTKNGEIKELHCGGKCGNIYLKIGV